jgi:hypothetical protein
MKLILLLLLAVYSLPAVAQEQKIIASTSSIKVDLTLPSKRKKWVNDWVNSLNVTLSTFPAEEADEYSREIMACGMQNMLKSWEKLPLSTRRDNELGLNNTFLIGALPPGDYLCLPADSGENFSFKIIENKEVSFVVYPPISEIYKNQRLLGEIEKYRAQPITTSPEQQQQARIDAYKRWRNSWKGRLYGARMSGAGFSPVYDPATGAEKWLPNKSINIIHY